MINFNRITCLSCNNILSTNDRITRCEICNTSLCVEAVKDMQRLREIAERNEFDSAYRAWYNEVSNKSWDKLLELYPQFREELATVRSEIYEAYRSRDYGLLYRYLERGGVDAS